MIDQTPRDIAKTLFELVPKEEGDVWYEPFKGEGAFYDLMPEPKFYSEINEGLDMFENTQRCDRVVTNPPFAIVIDRKKQNGTIATLEKCFEVTNKSVSYLINLKCLNALTPVRLKRYSDAGWNITRLHIINIPLWFGRYYFITFEKGKPSIITF